MSTEQFRSRWAAIGAAVAVTLGAGGFGIVSATDSSGERAIFDAIEPCRLADTRSDFAVGPRTSPLGPNEIYTLDGRGTVGDCDLPSDVTALSLNVTGLEATAPTFFTLFPGSASPPTASHLNLVPGAPPTPNAVNVDIDADGEFSVLNRFGFAQLIIDVVGVYRAHDHDDRYYRKTEVDAAIEQSSTMWARVNPDGTRRASSTRVTTEKYLGWAGGVYTITFPQTVTNCAFSVTRSDDYTDRVSAQAVAGADLSSPLEPTQVFVSFISDDSGSAANQYAFSITANC